MKGNQIKEVGEPKENDDAATKKFVSDLIDNKTAFNVKNSEYKAKHAILLKKNKLGGLRDPSQDYEAATKNM